MDKKKMIIGGIIGVIAIVVIVICVVVFSGDSKNNAKELTTTLEKLGKTFYEDYYYPSQEKSQSDIKEFVKRFEKNGIKINLTNLSKISSIDTSSLETLVNKKTNKKCDYEKTTITIIPKSPYGKADYELKVNLDCGFEENKDTKK